MVEEGKWHTVTKSSCFSSDKDIEKTGMHYYDNLLTCGSEFKLQ